MKRLISALAAAFKAATSSLTTVWSFCKDTGKWVSKTVASIGGGGAPEVGGHDNLIAAENDIAADALIQESNDLLASIEVPKATGGDGYDRIQRICRAYAAGEYPDEWDLVKLSVLQAEWIESMTDEMLFVVGNERRQAVIDHMKGGKGLRGVIRCDNASLKDWKHALEMEQARSIETEDPAPDQEKAPALRMIG